ncbi:NAD(P)-dependent dehydrogenase (short-subunit alcohol dehydrogenase family) [Paraburkholderia youngii]|uniref:SDR family NAD(P)-dependent oxidoreductase n=1 Tax=Paraburkholderia youngii TaxID=2782701 RepID=UPI003D190DA1
MNTVAITGAEQGLGLELVRLYAQDGHSVLAGCLNPGRAEITRLASDFPNVKVLQLDVTREGSVAAFADVLRGNRHMCGHLQVDTSTWSATVRDHVRGAICTSQGGAVREP